MKFFKVTDGCYDNGFYLVKENAQKKADETNSFIDENKDNPMCKNMKLDKYYVHEIETED